ncbi:TonB-dependent receptor [Porphyromonadaceae bacterium OttesenSCG-928-L07]|nr:TonB-dependent receptor [Porphyromonadaceae bacterium OttesenSCG-928-L07]
MKKAAILSVLFILLSIQLCFAQTREITGSVIDKNDKQALPGVSVTVKGSQPTVGTITNSEGNFSIQVNNNSTLTFSFIGMLSQEVIIDGSQSNFTIELTSETETLDEVIVVAYGTQKKSSFTGSATSVSGDRTFKDLPVQSFEQALQGATPGVVVSGSSGQPGGAINIRIRGTGSMNATNNPLYVIDGVPVIAGDIGVSNIKNQTREFNSMTSINPADIESITVLKDAAAASLYGSRAANGVILITTKQGKKGKTTINFKASYGISDWAVKNREMLNGDQQHELAYEGFYNEAILYKNYSEADAQAYAQSYAQTYAPKLDKYSDWEKALFNDHGTNQSYEFSAQGGGENTTFYASLGYKKDVGMSDASKLEGFSGKINISHKADKLSIGANISLSKQYSHVNSEGSAYSNPYFTTRSYYKPNFNIYNEDGSYNEGFPFADLKIPNVVKDAQLDKNTADLFRSINTLWASYEFIKGLIFKQTVSYDFIFNETTTYWPANSNNGAIHNGMMIKTPYQHRNLYSSSILTYTTKIADLHHLDLLVGWDVDDKQKRYTQAAGKNYSGIKLPELINSSVPTGASSLYYDDHLYSLLSRVNYDYNDKYYLSGTYRRDGSSRLGSNNRWGDFWSASLAWRITQEEFMQNITWLNDLKLRASYGVNGTLPTDLYGHLDLFGTGEDYQDEPGEAPKNVPNPDLAWEKNHNLDIGLDVTLFHRIYLTLDYYLKNTKDLIQEVPISYTTGFAKSLQNVGSMRNRGIEIDLSADIFKHAAVKWHTGLALAHNKNEVTKLYDGKEIVDNASFRAIREGESYYSFWVREWAGVDPETGEELWVSNALNEDGTLNKELTKDPAKAQRTIVGKADPKLTGGWRNTVSWKGLTLNALFSFSVGGKILDMFPVTYTDTDGGKPLLGISKRQLDRWQKPGDKTNVPRRIANYKYTNYGSDRFMYKSDHLRLKSVSLSYDLPANLLNRAGLKTVRVFASGSNLLTWKHKDNILDPEQKCKRHRKLVMASVENTYFRY